MTTPAASIRDNPDLDTLASGKRADLILLASDPTQDISYRRLDMANDVRPNLN